MNRVLIGVAGAALLSSCSFGQTFYSNLGPGDSFDVVNGWAIGGASSSIGYWEDAYSFTAAISGVVGSIVIPIYHNTGVNAFKVNLWTSSGGGLPGSSIFSTTVQGGIGFPTDPPLTIQVAGGPTLLAGTKYWISVGPGDATTLGSWEKNSTGASSTEAHRNGQAGAWSSFGTFTEGAFRVSTVPEPVSLTAVVAGLAVFAKRRRRS